MRTSSTIVLAAIGWIGLSSIPNPLNATIIGNFEMTVDSVTDPRLAPPIGTKGFGTLTFDESQIQYNNTPVMELYPKSPFGYYTRTASSLSLDFFNRHYTQIYDYNFGHTLTHFSFVPTETGGYKLTSFAFSTVAQDNGILLTSSSFNNNALAYGTVRITNSEEVPEPSTIAGVPIAFSLGWLFHQRLKRKRSKTTSLK